MHPTCTTPIELSPGCFLERPEKSGPFFAEQVLISKGELIELRQRAHYWEAQHLQATRKIAELEQTVRELQARIKALEHRLFGKKSEQGNTQPSEAVVVEESSGRSRGQQEGSRGHGRTPCPMLPVQEEHREVAEDARVCPECGEPLVRREALDEISEVKEVEVRAYIRRIHRHTYIRGCQCSPQPVIVTAPPPARLIPRSPYGISIWVEVILHKYHYGQPTHRLLQDWSDQGLELSPGTIAGGLQAIAPLFEPVFEALYCRQMQENVFHGDETRWEVFVTIEDKVGTRWYLWVFRSASVIFYTLDPSRSAAVPGAHFAGLQSTGQVIIVCDRYSAYKKLARLSSEMIRLAFCWAHVRRDFLDAGRSQEELSNWALEWRDRISAIYHLNAQRLREWVPQLPLDKQSAAFKTQHQALTVALESVRVEAERLAAPEPKLPVSVATAFSRGARQTQRKIAKSLLEHWSGLRLFLDHPAVPMDNNLAENAIRGPVVGRKNYYGSGSIWSAALAAMLFTLLQTLALWGLPVRRWLNDYLQACADNGGQPPGDITPFLPWSLADAPRATRVPSPPVAPDIIDTS